MDSFLHKASVNHSMQVVDFEHSLYLLEQIDQWMQTSVLPRHQLMFQSISYRNRGFVNFEQSWKESQLETRELTNIYFVYALRWVKITSTLRCFPAWPPVLLGTTNPCFQGDKSSACSHSSPRSESVSRMVSDGAIDLLASFTCHHPPRQGACQCSTWSKLISGQMWKPKAGYHSSEPQIWKSSGNDGTCPSSPGKCFTQPVGMVWYCGQQSLAKRRCPSCEGAASWWCVFFLYLCSDTSYIQTWTMQADASYSTTSILLAAFRSCFASWQRHKTTL